MYNEKILTKERDRSKRTGGLKEAHMSCLRCWRDEQLQLVQINITGV